MIDNTGSEAARPEVASFYDAFSDRLLGDYVQGNRRFSLAVRRVESAITPRVRRILDVGCGIGASSAAYRSGRGWLSVHGVDISPKNVEIARKLFGGEGLTFGISDMMEDPPDGTFDMIAMIDVYEHIPRKSWREFNAALARSLSPQGVLVLTTPSPLHQAYLAKNNPSGLQVIDETVECEDIVALASDLSGTLVSYEMVSIWNSNDYLHVVIDRDPHYEAIDTRFLSRSAILHGLSRLRSAWNGSTRSRRMLVRDRLDLRVG